ncbi:MAG: SIS domain-containing protein [Holophagaceae bacterium]|nr:SIS domain-containing protein [Holophagaceae bacterium]
MLNRIQSLNSEFSRSERKIADVVLRRAAQVASAPVAQIAKWADVSQPTVVRFCRRLGCKGVTDFKLQLTSSLASGLPFVHARISPGDKAAGIVSKVFGYAMAGLAHTREHLDVPAVEQAIAALDGASRIECYGMGNSGVTAMDAQMKLFRFGIPTMCYTDAQMQRMTAVLLPPGAVVLAISNSGRTRALLEVVELAKRAGAAIIGITRQGTPLAKVCDILLSADVPENPEVYAPMVSRLVHLGVIDVLTVGLALRRGSSAIHQLEAVKAALKATLIDEPGNSKREAP